MYVYPGSDVCYSWEEGKEGGGGQAGCQIKIPPLTLNEQES
jgi:hypothetical protein